MESTQDILQEELNILKDDIISQQKQNKQYVTGRTASGYQVVTSLTSGQLLGYSYVGVLERGRKGGKVPYNFHKIIEQWIKAKKLSFKSEEDLARWAKAIVYKIKKEGTKLYRTGNTEDTFDKPLADFTERLTKRLAFYYTAETTKQLFQ